MLLSHRSLKTFLSNINACLVGITRDLFCAVRTQRKSVESYEGSEAFEIF